MSRGFFFHLHPPEVAEESLRFRATFGLGLILIVLFLTTAVTGLFLMLFYVPSPAEARGSILDITYAVTFGDFARSLHRLAGHTMVLVALLHLLRTWLLGAYIEKPLNFYIGLALLFVILGLAFTGYLLPWDQSAYWAVTVSSNLADAIPLVGGTLKRMLLGDEAVGGAALVRFYALHTAVLPAVMFLLIGYHLFRVRRDGGLARSEAPMRTVSASHLMVREATLAVSVLLLLFIAALLYTAPIGGPPDFHRPSDPEKTPWYFLFLQEMVSYSTPVGGFLFPLTVVLLLLAVPLADRDSRCRGRFLGDRAEKAAFFLSFLGGAMIFAAAAIVFNSAAMQSCLSGASPLLRDVMNPASLMLAVAILGGSAVLLRTKSRRAAFAAIFAVLLIAVLGFSVLGACRGPGWRLTWPGEVDND